MKILINIIKNSFVKETQQTYLFKVKYSTYNYDERNC